MQCYEADLLVVVSMVCYSITSTIMAMECCVSVAEEPRGERVCVNMRVAGSYNVTYSVNFTGRDVQVHVCISGDGAV